jgi:hypothetical protein
MDPSDLIAGVAVVIAGASALFAWTANRRAADALELQRSIDAREREFRDVSWGLSWSPWTRADETPSLQLSNLGLTTAVDVTLVLLLPTMQQAIHVGTVEPGETRTVEIAYSKTGPAQEHVELIRDPIYRLQWSSPLGQPDEAMATAAEPRR